MILPPQSGLLSWVQTPKGCGWSVTVVDSNVRDPPSGALTPT